MSNLVAIDLRHRNVVRRRWSLVEGVELPLGRTVQSAQIQASWDKYIADWHAVVRWEQGRLFVKRCSSTNGCGAIFYGGEERDEFALIPGEGFVIGRTIFKLDPSYIEKGIGDEQFSSKTQFFRVEDLTQLTTDSSQLEVINSLFRQFQERQLNMASFEAQVVQTLKQVVPRADFAAILHIAEGDLTVHCSSGESGVCEPLVTASIQKQMLVAHRWGESEESSYPAVHGTSWAICTPVISDVQTEGDYAIYLSGARSPILARKGSHALPEEQLSLVAIVADILQSSHKMCNLAKCRESMGEFFPKAVRDQIATKDIEEVFRTDEVDAAILFCDLRGSSKFAEKQSADLMAAWDRIKEALKLMTEAITNQDGSIGDFQGDAAMGFWGWPRTPSVVNRYSDHAQSACQAADMLRERFEQASRKGLLPGFACGIGIAAGRVVAGMLGTEDQRKIGVFGPAVNLASRLESLTKQMGTPILVDDRTQEILEKAGSKLASRLRYVACVRPAGMTTSVKVNELMPPPSSSSAWPKAHLNLFKYGRESFEKGRWTDASTALEKLAAAGDGPAKFLVDAMKRLSRPPADWNGCLTLNEK